MKKWKETACHDSLCPLLHASSSLSAVSPSPPRLPAGRGFILQPDGRSLGEKGAGGEEEGRRRREGRGPSPEEWRPGTHDPTEEGRRSRLRAAPLQRRGGRPRQRAAPPWRSRQRTTDARRDDLCATAEEEQRCCSCPSDLQHRILNHHSFDFAMKPATR
jgi:hypothetical protein